MPGSQKLIQVINGLVVVDTTIIVMAEYESTHWVLHLSDGRTVVLSLRVKADEILSWNENLMMANKSQIVNTSYLAFIEYRTRRCEMTIPNLPQITLSIEAYKKVCDAFNEKDIND